MNHPSEWTRYYDVPKGTYRYRHKGTGVVRDTLMAIGKRFNRQALKKAVNEASKQMLKKAAEKAEEKAADKIQTVLRSGVSATQLLPTPQSKTPSVKPKGKTPQRALSTESKQKLKKMLTSGVKPHTPGTSKLTGDSRKKLNQIRAAKLKVNQYLAEN